MKIMLGSPNSLYLISSSFSERNFSLFSYHEGNDHVITFFSVKATLGSSSDNSLLLWSHQYHNKHIPHFQMDRKTKLEASRCNLLFNGVVGNNFPFVIENISLVNMTQFLFLEIYYAQWKCSQPMWKEALHDSTSALLTYSSQNSMQLLK